MLICFLRRFKKPPNPFLRRVQTAVRLKKPRRLALLEYQRDHLTLVQENVMRKISTHVVTFLIALAALTPASRVAAIDGALKLTSSDPGVLAVTPLEGGLFRVEVVGHGFCTLRATGDADLTDGVKSISTDFTYQVVDPGPEADHFALTASGFTYREAPAVSVALAAASEVETGAGLPDPTGHAAVI